jgi:hypothetical protein
MEKFRRAAETRDIAGLFATLAEDVVLHSPIVHRPYVGRQQAGMILRAFIETVTDFHYQAELGGDGRSALVFRAKVGELDIEGVDLFTPTADGLVGDLTVFVRPFRAAQALAEAMRARLIGAVSPAGD